MSLHFLSVHFPLGAVSFLLHLRCLAPLLLPFAGCSFSGALLQALAAHLTPVVVRVVFPPAFPPTPVWPGGYEPRALHIERHNVPLQP